MILLRKHLRCRKQLVFSHFSFLPKRLLRILLHVWHLTVFATAYKKAGEKNINKITPFLSKIWASDNMSQVSKKIGKVDTII